MIARKWIIPATIATLLVQALILGAMLRGRYVTLRDGEQVTLKTRFVDPRDIFRGHYVRLNLQSDERELALPMGEDGEPLSRTEIYVELAPGEDGFWAPKTLYADLPPIETPVLRANLSSVTPIAKTDPPLAKVRVTYPFDRYFAHKERALALETLRADQRLGVIVALDGEGGGVIAGVTVDGEKIYDEPLF